MKIAYYAKADEKEYRLDQAIDIVFFPSVFVIQTIHIKMSTK